VVSMLLRIAGAVLSVLVTAQAFACSITVTPLPQQRVKDAAIIVEGTARAEQLTFAVGKAWKGAAPATIAMRPGSIGSCDEVPAIIEGNRYLILIYDPQSDVEDGVTVYRNSIDVLVYDSPESRKIRKYLSGGKSVARADVVAMVRKWHYSVVSDRAFAEWVHEIAAVADVDDWDDEGSVPSAALHVLTYLDSAVNERGEKCVAFARMHVAPYLIEMLGPRPMSDERMDEIEAELEERTDEYEQCS
jgi:hypothetical protein